LEESFGQGNKGVPKLPFLLQIGPEELSYLGFRELNLPGV